MTPLEIALRKQLYKTSFYDFVKYFWNTADPSKYTDGKLVQFYCEAFQYMCRSWVGYDEIEIDVPKSSELLKVVDIREGKHNLNLNIPPRHSKSMIFNVMGPVWLWLHAPVKCVSVSHTAGLANQMNAKRYSIINSEQFKELYGDEIVLVANSKTFLKDSRGGELYSINRNAFTGYGGDVIINDDLTNAETARKDMAEMNSAWSYFQNTMPSRINDINKCIIMNIQQRLAPNDITGHILSDRKLAQQYTFVTLPAVCQVDTDLVCPISGDIIHYLKGEGLWPERFGNYVELEANVGSTIFRTQYLQDPVATDATVIKKSMIVAKTIDEVPSIDQAEIIYSSDDFPIKDKESSDYLGSVLAYRVGAMLYIIDCLEARMDFVKSIDYVTNVANIYHGVVTIVEDKANGSPIIQELQDKVPGVQAYNPGTKSKIQRLESASIYMNAGNVVFVKTKKNEETNKYEFSEGMSNLVKRLLDFPFVKHDDIVDACTMLISFAYLDKRYSVYGRSFNADNVIEYDDSFDHMYKNIFFNKEGDIFKCSLIGIQYGEVSSIVVLDEMSFKSTPKEALSKMAEWYHTSLIIDCSLDDSMSGVYIDGVSVEPYKPDDFAQSVLKLNLAFSKKTIKIVNTCKSTYADIDNFKYVATKDESQAFRSEHDGYVANIRSAILYYGGII